MKILKAISNNHYVSFFGTYNRLEYLGITLLLSSIYNRIIRYDLILLSLLAYLIVLYFNLTAIQKRCRDFNVKGTIFVFLFPFCFMVFDYFYYIRKHEIQYNAHFNKILFFAVSSYIIGFLILLLVPGKKEKNMGLISPLLRHPYLYVGVCYILYLIGFYYLMQF